MRRLVFLAILAFHAAAALGANCSSTNGGNWNNGAIWSCGITPTAADDVTINNGHNVSLNGANRSALSLVINTGGTLTTGSNNITIAAGTGVLTINGNVAGNGNANSRIIKNSTGGLSGGGTITNVNDVTIIGDTTIAPGSALTFTGAECRLDLAANADVINNGTLTFDAAACGTSKVINLANPATFTNNGTVITGSIVGANATGSAWTNATGSTLEVTAALLATGTLDASAAGNTVHYNSGANLAVKLPTNGDYFHLTLSGASTKTPAAGTYDILGNLTINAGATFNVTANDPTINVIGNAVVAGTYTASNVIGSALTITGDLTVSGTFTASTSPVNLAGNFTRTGTYSTGAGVFTFNGTSGTPQTFTGATTITNVTINNGGAGVALANDLTLGAAGTLVLTNGRINTGGNSVITPRNCDAPSVTRTNGWVNGNLAKTIPNGASTCTFEIGDAARYAPVVATFVAGTGGGLLTASTTGSEHPQLGSSAIDPTNSVNRYWTMANVSVTLPAAGYSLSFNFVNPDDIDVPANVGTYTVEQWTGSTWLPSAVSTTCTAVDGAHLCKTITSEVAFGDFAIGGALAGFNAIPGPFNAFEVTASTTQILGRVFTKLVSTNFTLSIVAINTTTFIRNTAPSVNALTIEVMDASTSGTFNNATNCDSGWVALTPATAVAAGAWTSGRKDITITAPTSGGAPRAVKNARIRVTQAGTGLVGCSTDNFSIRPAGLAITSSATQTGTSGTPAIKTGEDFTITAQARDAVATNVTAGYIGTPTVDNSQVVGSPTAGSIGGTFNAGTGATATGSQFWYSEVGNFGLNANAIVDSTFVVDPATDCVANNFSNTLSGGQYGCVFGSAAVPLNVGSTGFGRFIPDNFDVSLNSPAFAASCGTFTYLGQGFLYGASAEPVMTVTARTGTAHGLVNAITRNYAGSYMKLTNASLAPAAYDTQGERYSRHDAGGTPALDTGSLPMVGVDPVIAFPAASPTSGVGTLTFQSGTGGLTFNRSAATPVAAFDADIALELNVIDGDGVAFASNPAKFGSTTVAGNGISFGGNKQMRYGRLRLLNAAGPTTVDLPITLRAEYYVNVSTGFVLNAADSCTSLAAGNFKLSGHTGSLTTINMPDSRVSVPANLTSGIATGMKLLKASPAVSTPGSVRICFDLDNAPAVGDTSCQAGTPAIRTYLQGPWSGGTYDKDPVGQVNVGTFGAQPNNFIFFRENY